MKQIEPLLWRIEGKSGDGKRVTLGKYSTKEQAAAEMAQLQRAGYYRDLAVVAIPPPPPPVPAAP